MGVASTDRLMRHLREDLSSTFARQGLEVQEVPAVVGN